MEIIRELKVSAGALFDVLLNSVANEVSQATGELTAPDEITEGLQYTKSMQNKLGMAGTTVVTIEELDVPRVYASRIDTDKDSYRVRYAVEPVTDEAIRVTYSEEVTGEGKLRELNWKLMSWLMKKSFQKRMAATLDQMERYILKQGGARRKGCTWPSRSI